MLTYQMLSQIGGRQRNEDAVRMAKRNEVWCFALADGLGGHGGGAEASQLVTDYVMEDFKQHGELSAEYLAHCFNTSQKELLCTQSHQGRPNEMKTTLVLLLADDRQLLWGHIGDSRLYHFQKKKLIGRTLDHSVPQMLAAAGEISEQEIRGHADRNRLLRVMGTEWETHAYQIAPKISWSKPTQLLLCSDGFWEQVEEKQMLRGLKKSKTPKDWLLFMEHPLKQQGLELGREMDNYSAIAVFLQR